jgi:hypothetical protein
MARLRQWVLANFASSWFLLAPLLAAYAPRRLFLTYFNLFLRRHARRVLTVVDPYVSLDISEKPAAPAWCLRNRSAGARDSTFEEVKARARRMPASSAPRAPRRAAASSSACATARTCPTSSGAPRSCGRP